MIFNFRGLGFDQEDAKEAAHRVMDRAGDAATETTKSINSAASGDGLFLFPSVMILSLDPLFVYC